MLGSLPTNLGYIGQKKIPETYQCVVFQILRSRLSLLSSVYLSESSYFFFFTKGIGVFVRALSERNSERYTYSLAVEVFHSLCFLKTMCKNIIYLDF